MRQSLEHHLVKKCSLLGIINLCHVKDQDAAVSAVSHGLSSSNLCFLKSHPNYGTSSETAELQSQIHTEVTEGLLLYQLGPNPILSLKELLEE